MFAPSTAGCDREETARWRTVRDVTALSMQGFSVLVTLDSAVDVVSSCSRSSVDLSVPLVTVVL